MRTFDGPYALGRPHLVSADGPVDVEATVPSARSIITIAVVSGLTFLAIEHFRERGGLGITTKPGGSRLRGVA